MRLSHKFILYGAVNAKMVSDQKKGGTEGQERVVDNAERYICDAPVCTFPFRFTTEN